MKNFVLLLCCFLFWSVTVSAQEQNELSDLSLEHLMKVRVKEISLPDIPHVHGKKEWMFSYHLMTMKMEDHLIGSAFAWSTTRIP
jgi:hypothetical protein